MAAAGAQAQATGEQNLRRDIGFLGLLALSVGINVGGGLFVLVNIAGAETGPSLPLAMLLSAIPALLAVVPYRVLARAYPTTSASYRYMKLAGERLAFMTAAGLLVAIVVGGQPLFARMTGDYLAELNGVTWSPTLIAAVVLTGFYLLNLAGVRMAMAAQSIMLFVLLFALAAFVVLGWGDIDAARFADPLPGGAIGLVTATVMLYALMAGGLFIVEVGGEVVEPRRMFGTVLPLGMAIVLLLYVGMTVVAVGAVPWQALEGGTLVDVAESFMSSGWLTLFILGGAVVAGVTTINGVFALVSRGILVVAEEGLFHPALARVNRRFGTPHWALTLCFVGSMLSLWAGPDGTFLGVLMNLGLVVAIAAVCLAAARLPRAHPELFAQGAGGISARMLSAVSWTVVGMNAFVALALASEAPAAAGLFLLVALLAGVWQRHVRAGAVDTGLAVAAAAAD